MNTMREILFLGALLCTVALAVPVVAVWKGTSHVFPAWAEFPERLSDRTEATSRSDAENAETAGPGPIPIAALALHQPGPVEPATTNREAALLPAAGLSFLCACLDRYMTR